MAQGRIVWVNGDLFKGKVKTDQMTRQPVKDPKTGENIIEYGFGLAIPKNLLSQMGEGQPGHIWAVMHSEAQALYPQGLPPSFAMKYKDGDGVDNEGKPFAQRTGYAGHIVLACTTRIPIKFFRFENNANVLVNSGIKCGDYVRVQLHVKAHGPFGQGKPGLYVSPMAVQFLGYGEEIINTPSGDQIFGAAAPVVPDGASATPIAPAAFPMQAMPGAPAGYPPPMAAAPAPAPAAPAPHYGVLPQAHQPPPGGMPMAPAAPPMPNHVGAPANAYPTPAPAPAPQGYPFPAAQGYAAPPAPAPMPGMPPAPGYPQQ